MTPQKEESWEERFDEEYEKAYCVDCLRGSWKRDHIKNFIRKEIEQGKKAEREKIFTVAKRLAEVEVTDTFCSKPYAEGFKHARENFAGELQALTEDKQS